MKLRIGIAVVIVLATVLLWLMSLEKPSEPAVAGKAEAIELATAAELIEPRPSEEIPSAEEYPSREALQQRGEIARQRTKAMLAAQQSSAHPGGEQKGYPLSIENLPARGIIDLYGQTSQRVVILGPQVTLNSRISVIEKDPETSKEQMLTAIKAALEKEDIVLQEAGDKFLFVINPRVTKHIPQLSIRDDPAGQAPGNPLRFENVRGTVLVDIYQNLSGRKAQEIPDMLEIISFHTSGLSLTINEQLTAIELLFALRGFSFEHRGEDSFVIERSRSGAQR